MEITVDDILRIVKGVSSGIYYGGKVRFMHSLVMSVLFMKGSPLQKLRAILKLTVEHALRLGIFVGVYKTAMLLLRKLEGRKSLLHCFLAGCIGAMVINLDGDTAINQQITFYIVSRSVFAGAKTLQNKRLIPQFNLFRTIMVFSWGFLMYIYARNKSNLQPSMVHSMDFLYLKSDKYHGWTDYVPVYMPLLFKKRIERFLLGPKQFK